MFTTQRRSLETRDAFIDAMAHALEEMPIDEINIADLARRAGKSVGSLYTKFRDKEALLEAVFARYESERATTSQDSQFLLEKWTGTSLEARIRTLAAVTVQEYRSRRGLFIAYQHRNRHRPADRERTASLIPLYDVVAQLLIDCRAEIAHEEPERAVRFAFLLLTSLCVSAILHASDVHPASLALTDEELTHRAGDAMLAYLTNRPNP